MATRVTTIHLARCSDFSVDLDRLKHNIQLVAEGLAQLVYEDVALDHANLFEGVNAFHPEFVDATARYLSSTPRMAPYLNAKAPVKNELHQVSTIKFFLERTCQTSHLDVFNTSNCKTSRHTKSCLNQILKRATSETANLDFPMNGEENYRQFLFFGSTGVRKRRSFFFCVYFDTV